MPLRMSRGPGLPCYLGRGLFRYYYVISSLCSPALKCSAEVLVQCGHVALEARKWVFWGKYGGDGRNGGEGVWGDDGILPIKVIIPFL